MPSLPGEYRQEIQASVVKKSDQGQSRLVIPLTRTLRSHFVSDLNLNEDSSDDGEKIVRLTSALHR